MIALLFAAMVGQTAQIPAEDWRSDVAILRRGLKEIHAGPYRYLSESQLDQELSRLEQRLSGGASLGQGFLAISELTAKLKCGHTYTNFLNQPESVSGVLFEGRNRLPFSFRWINRKMIVVNPMTSGLKRGAEVLSINGIPARTVLQTLLQIARADGSNDAKRVSYLEVTGEDAYEAFDIYYPLYFPLQRPEFRLQVRQPGGGRVACTLPAIDRKARLSLRAAESDPASAVFTDRMVGDAVVLTMPTWALFNSKWKWQSYLNDFMGRIIAAKVPKLIINIRQSEGGMDIGDVILARITNRTIAKSPYNTYTRYRKVPDDLNPYLSTWDPTFRDWGTKAREEAPGRYRLVRGLDGDALPIAPRGPRFEGKVVVLMGPVNSSATFQFVSTIKREGLATLVGQPSGGNLRGLNGGAFFFLELPRSHIEVDLPLIAYMPTSPQPDAGVLPDVEVKPSEKAVAEGRDIELETALRL